MMSCLLLRLSIGSLVHHSHLLHLETGFILSFFSYLFLSYDLSLVYLVLLMFTLILKLKVFIVLLSLRAILIFFDELVIISIILVIVDFSKRGSL